jgi:hypothetical protein
LVLSRAKFIEPQKASIREALGRALFISGRVDLARQGFAKMIQLPSDDYGHYALSLACERTGRRSRGLGHAKLAVVLRAGVRDCEAVLARLSA